MSSILDYYHLEKKSLRNQRLPYKRARLWQVGLLLLVLAVILWMSL